LLHVNATRSLCDNSPYKTLSESTISCTMSGGISGAYVGWIGTGNFGDEVLFDIFGLMLTEAFGRETGKRVSLRRQSKPWRKCAWNAEATRTFLVIGGGSMLTG